MALYDDYFGSQKAHIEAHLKRVLDKWKEPITEYFKKNLPYPDRPEYREGNRNYVEAMLKASISRGDHGGIQYNGPLGIHFTLNNYPYCCAYFMMYGFSHPSIPDELKQLFWDFLDAAFESVHFHIYMKNRRVECMMVEDARFEEELKELVRKEGVKDERYLKEIPNIGNRLRYPLFYEYFQSKGIIKEDLCYNQNSGNIIHRIEAIID